MNVRECKKCGMNFGLSSTRDPRKLCPECSTRKYNRYNQIVEKAGELVSREEEYLKRLSDLEERIEVTLETRLNEFMLDMEAKVWDMIEEKITNKVMTIHTRTVRMTEQIEALREKSAEHSRKFVWLTKDVEKLRRRSDEK
jgi:predicted  nucleic acid-binding Zn-ribbon protein